MNKYGLMFHHLGLAVTKKEKAVRFTKDLGYRMGDEINDPLQNVNLIMCHSDTMPDIEIISRLNESGPLDVILKDRSELIYHICYTSENLESSLKAIEESGNRILCVSASKPAVLFDNKIVSFYLIDGFGLIEILQR